MKTLRNLTTNQVVILVTMVRKRHKVEWLSSSGAWKQEVDDPFLEESIRRFRHLRYRANFKR
jgi:hypothetical protein